MSRRSIMTMGDLFSDLESGPRHPETLAEGATLLRGFAEAEAADLVAALGPISEAAAFRHMVTPGGHTMSVAMTNCGDAGWVTDRGGYRYDARDPQTGQPWPAMPAAFRDLATRAAATAGFAGFTPNSCLVNRYAPKSRMSLHQDKDEGDFSAPIISVSLGQPAIFLFGGLKRIDRPRRIRLKNGDVVVWGGPARMTYHGVAPLAEGSNPLTGNCRLNLTFRTTQNVATSNAQ
jgi:alkylated DNA repair protein (DNA oxidative demethylase)